jgi:hypothetical protein
MSKKIIVWGLAIIGLVILSFVMCGSSKAASTDPDGILSIGWVPPVDTYQDTLAGFNWSLTTNGVFSDSGSVARSVVQLTNFKTLSREGDYAIFKIRAFSKSSHFSVSTWVTSDTCFFDSGAGIQPPTGLHWITGSSLGAPATTVTPK